MAPPVAPRVTPWMRALPVVAVVVGVALTLVLWNVTASSVEAQRDQRFWTEQRTIEGAIESRFLAYEQVLRGGLALWMVDQDVSMAEWAAYVDGLELEVTYPGIQGVGYSLFIDAEDLDGHEAEMRAAGFPDYRVHDVAGDRPPGPVHTSIIYLEPFDTRNQAAHGLDMYSHPERRKAMDRAIDQGVPALSGRVILVQEIDEDVQPGFLLYLPHYEPPDPQSVAERRASVVGFVYAPFRAHDLMTGILGQAEPELTFEVYDGTPSPDTILYDDDPDLAADQSAGASRAVVAPLTLAGRTWTIQYATTPAFEAATANSGPSLVIASGLIVSGLMGGLAYSLTRTQARAVELATRMTAELRRSEREKARLAEDLARSNADLAQFAYVASHDLQEPVRTVHSYIDLFERRHGKDVPPDAMAFLDTARRSAQRMRGLINDLLDYSRAGREARPSAPTDAGVAFATAMEETKASIEAAEARIDVEPGLPAVYVRDVELVRVFTNLISNAVKYRADRPLRIRVSARPVGGMWEFAVEDNGIGIPADSADKVFAMFGRLHSRDEYEGSGMGLAISKRIVEAVGGDMWFESTLGEGTTVKFTAPGGEAE